MTKRSEIEIFTELASLTRTTGYAHALAAFCFRDNTVRFENEVNAEDIVSTSSEEKLTHTELSTLIGLMIQGDVDLTLPAPDKLQHLLDETERLLTEIHQSMLSPMHAAFADAAKGAKSTNPFSHESMLREAIFYGGESAYSSQYRDLSAKKYHNDNDWLRKHKGFAIEEALMVIRCICQIQDDKIPNTLENLRKKKPDEWTMLPTFILTTNEIVNQLKIDPLIVNSVLRAFALPSDCKNEQFKSISDFNAANAFPLIPLEDEEYLLFQNYSACKALYESPFYWMLGDNDYLTQAMTNRGSFTEKFCTERLQLVFGKDRVFRNVLIVGSKGQTHGEIDVLVVFANRAIILQAKSKRLTIESWKGNDNQIRDDFKQGIQDSYNQGLSCTKLLNNKDMNLLDINSNRLEIPRSFKEIYILCVLSDHYPSLAFQTSYFLQIEQDDSIIPPFVMDIFLLDAMTEMLQSPLLFLSYINRRTKYADKIMATHEFTVFACHLKYNLWLESDLNMLHLNDDFCAVLDVAMMTRREGLPGKVTPEGILTLIKNTSFGHLIQQIEEKDDVAVINLGFMLLTLNEEAIHSISKGINDISRRVLEDSQPHDFTIGFGNNKTGLTIHCNRHSQEIGIRALERHCHRRKYLQKADSWFGICIEPINKHLRFGINLEFLWESSEEMDKAVKDFPNKQPYINLRAQEKPKKKIGRNNPCPCGSGQKYKKCCGK